MKELSTKCSRCGSPDVVPILYGMPTNDALALAEEGKLILGGCGITPEAPQWECQACQRQAISDEDERILDQAGREIAKEMTEEVNKDAIEIKDWYEHEHSPGVFVMFRKNHSLVWSFSGNELRRGFLAKPDEFISGPIECSIPQALYDQLSDDLDNF